MIPRKRLDIGWRDLLFGMRRCLSGDRREEGHAACRESTGDPDEAVFFLSLRSGFDACLREARFPRGSHILVSAITIPDIIEIIRSHGLVPVPVDLDPLTLEPDPDSLNSGLTSRTVALLATHLFGARISMDPLVRFARMHGLLLFEDCAQAHWGDGFTGHPDSDVRMFSFGPIKYHTALGGGLLFVGDPVLRGRIRRLHSSYPVQSKGWFFLRLAKYGVVLLLNRPGPYTLLCAACRLLGRSHDAVGYRATRGFRGLELLRKIRRQPCGALLDLLSRRLHSNALRSVGCRPEALAFHRSIPDLCYPGRSADHSYWLFVVRVGNAADLCRRLWDAGIDAHLWPPSLCVVKPVRDLPGQAPTSAIALGPQLLFLPVYPQVGRIRLAHLSRIVRQRARSHG
ncbi:MAG: DegT/DnrJ/EryC1/StrS family aminotransferase [Gemmatimonadota bacterium]|nr:DegT/DnrJ/EryC1/StrS family aminotransferase [Gemmatimonadota bacterium]